MKAKHNGKYPQESHSYLPKQNYRNHMPPKANKKQFLWQEEQTKTIHEPSLVNLDDPRNTQKKL